MASIQFDLISLCQVLEFGEGLPITSYSSLEVLNLLAKDENKIKEDLSSGTGSLSHSWLLNRIARECHLLA